MEVFNPHSFLTVSFYCCFFYIYNIWSGPEPILYYIVNVSVLDFFPKCNAKSVAVGSYFVSTAVVAM